MAGAGAAFRELLDLLRDADQTFLTGPRADMDETGVAEGYRHLTHLLGYALDLHLEGDAERPGFVRLAPPTRRILGENVDQAEALPEQPTSSVGRLNELKARR